MFKVDEDSTFTMETARDLFREVFGEEIVAKLASAADNISPHLRTAGSVVAVGLEKVAEGAAPHVKAAASATVSGLTTAAEKASKSRIVRGTVAAHLSSLTDDAVAQAASLSRDEVISRKACDDAAKALKDHDKRVSLMLKARSERRVGWWKALKEWATCEQQESDERADRQAELIAQQLKKRMRHSEKEWRYAQRALADAEAAASRAQLQEEDVVRNGASLGDAAMVGMAYLARFVEKIPAPGLLTTEKGT